MEHYKIPFRWVIAGVLFLCILVMQMSYACLPPLFSEISKDIPLSKIQMGTIFGMIPLSGLAFSLIGGAISDRFGSRLAVGGALFIAAVFGVLRSYASGVMELMFLTFFVGAAVALIPPNIAKVLGTWFPKNELGKANGIVVAGVPIGVGLGIGTGASVLLPIFGGWEGVMNFIAVLCLLMGVVWVLVYREQKPDSVSGERKQNILDNFREVFAISDVWLVAAFCGCFFYAVGPLIGLLPIVLEERGIGQAGAMASLFMLAGVFGSLAGGMASDKVGKRKPFLIVSAVVLGICIPLFINLTGIPLVAALVIAGFAQGVIMPVMLATVIEIRKIGVAHGATAIGLVMTVGSAVGFLGPVVSGRLMDISGSPWSAFGLMTTVLIVAAFIAIFLERGSGIYEREAEE